MDAIDILGSILGGAAGGGGKPGGGGGSGGGMGGKILRDILGAGRGRGSGGSRPAPSPSRQNRTPDISAQADELEDLLNVANGREPGRPEPGGDSGGGGRAFPGFPPADPGRSRRPPPLQRPAAPDYNYGHDQKRQNEEAVILVRAMVNAAKADGRIGRDEQQAILQRVSGPSREAADFLRREFDRPLDVREFVWSVPAGMEQKVYALSLATIDLDNNAEAEYLRDLAHGLRLSDEVRDGIHDRFRAPHLR